MASLSFNKPYKSGLKGNNLVSAISTGGTVKTWQVLFRDSNGNVPNIGILSCNWGGGLIDLLYLITDTGHVYQLNNDVTNPTNYWTVTLNKTDYIISVTNTSTTMWSAIRLYVL